MLDLYGRDEGYRREWISKNYHLQRVFLKYFQLFFSIISGVHLNSGIYIWKRHNLRKIIFSIIKVQCPNLLIKYQEISPVVHHLFTPLLHAVLLQTN